MALPGSRPVVALESITKTNGVGSDTRHHHCHRSFTRKQILLNITTSILGKKIIQNIKPVVPITAVMTTWDRLKLSLIRFT